MKINSKIIFIIYKLKHSRNKPSKLYQVDNTVDTENLYFQIVIYVSVDKHLFSTTLKVKITGNDSIFIHGFCKNQAQKFKELPHKH